MELKVEIDESVVFYGMLMDAFDSFTNDATGNIGLSIEELDNILGGGMAMAKWFCNWEQQQSLAVAWLEWKAFYTEQTSE